jgi:hypothetical protein
MEAQGVKSQAEAKNTNGKKIWPVQTTGTDRKLLEVDGRH